MGKSSCLICKRQLFLSSENAVPCYQISEMNPDIHPIASNLILMGQTKSACGFFGHESTSFQSLCQQVLGAHKMSLSPCQLPPVLPMAPTTQGSLLSSPSTSITNMPLRTYLDCKLLKNKNYVLLHTPSPGRPEFLVLNRYLFIHLFTQQM